ncbi:stAR-related lipid transfer protein 7, mitochondrial-like [Sitophilus oryzae]|uniref:Phosphatidylcholine transfer protein n=1 Tax=Sitophilus oryzae TaxID=7048 RepID=A0A6J2XUD8_SITOR|nr:stAR-related lipid transfer protein 7, mitochondrial-like [Sitophilus oryzae]
MYARKLSQNLSPLGTPNMKGALAEKCIEGFTFAKGTVMRRQFSKWKDVKDLKDKLSSIIDKAKVLKENLFRKSNSEKTFKMWIRQFECVIAQRVRRGQQMFSLYSRLWEERALKELVRRLRISFTRNGREFIIGATGISLFNWEDNRIRDEEFEKHLDDLDYIEVLKENTMNSPDGKSNSSSSTSIKSKSSTGSLTSNTYDDWVPFIAKDDLLVWKRPYGNGLFEYKVYGSYHDVTAEDFLQVQVDTDYRKEWDTTAIQLEVGERDTGSDSDILYWEMQWPRLFVNRDYVFNRRYKVFEDSKTLMIINKTTEYPRFPKYPDKFRVEEYWSCMVIKPYTDIKQPGIEFSLTYFDNPGVNIPSSVTTWVAKSAMPDFLAKLRNASKKYKDYCLNKGVSKACQALQEEERLRREEEEKNKLDYCSNERLSLVLLQVYEDIQRKANEKLLEFKRSEIIKSGALVKKVEQPVSEEMSQLPGTANSQNTNQNRTFWKYLHPLYYFT